MRIDEAATVAELIGRGVAAGVGPMLEDERLGRVVEIEAVGVSEELETCWREQIAGIAQAIENLLGDLMRSGRIPVFEPGLVGLMVVGGMTEALVAHLSTSPPRRTDPVCGTGRRNDARHQPDGRGIARPMALAGPWV